MKYQRRRYHRRPAYWCLG